MPQKQSPRVPVLPDVPLDWDVQQAEDVQQWDAPTPVVEYNAALSFQPLLRLATLAQRMAARYVAGKSGLALENDARETMALWNALPDELKALL